MLTKYKLYKDERLLGEFDREQLVKRYIVSEYSGLFSEVDKRGNTVKLHLLPLAVLCDIFQLTVI